MKNAWMLVALLVLLACKSEKISPDKSSGDPTAGSSSVECPGLENAQQIANCQVQGAGSSIVQLDKLKNCSFAVPAEAVECSKWGKKDKPPEQQNSPFSSTYDECGCEGRVCPDGKQCVAAIKPVGPTPNPPKWNQCMKTCSVTAACDPDEVCLPPVPGNYDVPVCVKGSCRSDADCTKDGACARCVIELTNGQQSFPINISAPHCVSTSTTAGGAD
jgi:hypothetical protein